MPSVAIAAHRDAMLACGAPFVRLSGSGPALFTLVESREEARGIARALRSRGIRGRIARLAGQGSALSMTP